MRTRIDRHTARRNTDKCRGKPTHGVRRLVNPGNERRDAEKQRAHDETGGNIQGNQLAVYVLCVFQLAGTEFLPDHNGNRIAHGHIDDVKNIGDRTGNIQGGNDGKPAQGVVLIEHGHTPSTIALH